MNLAIITSSKVPELLDYDKDLLKIIESYGINVEPIIWDNGNYDIASYDVFLMRTAWDYFLKASEFRTFIEGIAEQRKVLLNPPEIIIPNMHKFYLKDLQKSGVEIIPTYFLGSDEDFDLEKFDELIGGNQFIVKPAISAGSYMTTKFNDIKNGAMEFISKVKAKTDVLIQKFMPEIEIYGEYSNIFFSNGYSYTILKKAKNGDFRVQKDYGGKYIQVIPDKIIYETAKKIAENYLSDALYVRVDGVFDGREFYIMEIEMIEPDLYMDINPNAKEQFVQALLSKINNKIGAI